MKKLILTSLILIFAAGMANAEPKEYSSPDLRPIKVKETRPMGRIFVQVNFSSHKIIVDGAEYPAYLADYGIEVTSNELHNVTVSNSAGAEKKYRLSVNPNETLMLYVDLGSSVAPKEEPPKKEEEKKEEKKDDASTGFVTITAETEAQIYIDGKLVASKTPLKKHEVNVGSHTIRVYFFDTRKFSKSREIYVGKGATMSLNFTKE
ncbi:MAG: PEGA domain-containing protein [Proteobacteria bacterium]|nr:PEGA domain-containing protein [Pseudomonadota bacterium]